VLGKGKLWTEDHWKKEENIRKPMEKKEKKTRTRKKIEKKGN